MFNTNRQKYNAALHRIEPRIIEVWIARKLVKYDLSLSAWLKAYMKLSFDNWCTLRFRRLYQKIEWLIPQCCVYTFSERYLRIRSKFRWQTALKTGHWLWKTSCGVISVKQMCLRVQCATCNSHWSVVNFDQILDKSFKLGFTVHRFRYNKRPYNMVLHN